MGELASCQILFQRKLKGCLFTWFQTKTLYFHYRHIFFFFKLSSEEFKLGEDFFFEKKKRLILMNSFFPVMKTQEEFILELLTGLRVTGNCHTMNTVATREKPVAAVCSREGRVRMWLPPHWKSFQSSWLLYHRSRTLVVLGGAQVRKPLSPKHHSHHLWAHWSSRGRKLGKEGCVEDHTQAHIVFIIIIRWRGRKRRKNPWWHGWKFKNEITDRNPTITVFIFFSIISSLYPHVHVHYLWISYFWVLGALTEIYLKP